MRNARSLTLGLGLLLAACEKPPSIPSVTEPQEFRVATELWSGASVAITSPAFATAPSLPGVFLGTQLLPATRVDDTTLVAALPDAPGAHSLRIVAPDVVTTPVTIYLRGYVDRIEGPALSGRLEPGRDYRYLFGSGPASLRRWNIATNKVLNLSDSVHAVSCTRGVGPGPNVGELALLTGGCMGTWMVWRTEPLTPLRDTTTVSTTDFVAVLRSDRWIVLDGGVFSIVVCTPGDACVAEPIAGLIGSDLARSAGDERAALIGRSPFGAPAYGAPVIDVGAGRVGYRVSALTSAKGAAFTPGGDTLFLAGDSAGVETLVAVRASDGHRLGSRALDFTPCAVAADSTRPWVYVAGITGGALPRSVLQVYDRTTLERTTTLHVTSDIPYGTQLCRIVLNSVERRVYVVETWAGEHNPAALAQLYTFETPRF